MNFGESLRTITLDPARRAPRRFFFGVPRIWEEDAGRALWVQAPDRHAPCGVKLILLGPEVWPARAAQKDHPADWSGGAKAKQHGLGPPSSNRHIRSYLGLGRCHLLDHRRRPYLAGIALVFPAWIGHQCARGLGGCPETCGSPASSPIGARRRGAAGRSCRRCQYQDRPGGWRVAGKRAANLFKGYYAIPGGDRETFFQGDCCAPGTWPRRWRTGRLHRGPQEKDIMINAAGKTSRRSADREHMKASPFLKGSIVIAEPTGLT